ncbi:MAG: DMT family transporter [Anaerolineae bacterium]|nr:DMT family transporter [Anaerolineae bacterium]
MERWRANIGLIVVTVIWGSTFVVVKNTLNLVSPIVLVTNRFLAASLALGTVYLILKPERMKTPVIRDGILTGMILVGGFVTQTIGLTTTEAGKTSFITGLNVVMVPIFSVFLLRKLPDRSAVTGVILATVGLGFLTLDTTLHFAPGDLWVLACAVFFALHIIVTDRLSPRHELMAYTMVQMVTVTVVSFCMALILGYPELLPPLPALPALLYLGVVATGLVYGLQTWAQRHTTATHTALIFVLEPVFAAAFAVLLAGENLSGKEWFGGLLILLGMVISEVRWERSPQTQPAG